MILSFSDFISLCTPLILFIWFLYSSRERLKKDYSMELIGSYGGFTEPIDSDIHSNAGLILNILRVDSNGYFQGELHYGENLTTITKTKELNFSQLREGFHSVAGRIEHTVYLNKERNIMKQVENRLYHGSLYVVDRLDYDFHSYNFEAYIQLDYQITHYREMNVIELKLLKNHKDILELAPLPKTATLYPTIGLMFDVPRTVAEIAFRGNKY